MRRYLSNRLFGVIVGLFVAIVSVVPALIVTSSVGATAEYQNSSVADVALRYVGQWGGQACTDSHKPGDRGGQCRSFVNCVVWMASGHTQNLGGHDYFKPFLRAGGQEIHSIDELQRGDIVQEGQGGHTYIIVQRIGDDRFTIVDSNRYWNEKVNTYERSVQLSSSQRAFRMGTMHPAITGPIVDPVAIPTAPAATSAPVAVVPGAVQTMLGDLESLTAQDDGMVMARGWAIDADVTRQVDVRLYDVTDVTRPTEGNGTTTTANMTRMDIYNRYPNFGSSHGFSGEMLLGVGDHIVCAYATNAPGTPGADYKLGCQAINVK